MLPDPEDVSREADWADTECVSPLDLKQDMIRKPPLEIETSFNSFARLPFEVRQQIWTDFFGERSRFVFLVPDFTPSFEGNIMPRSVVGEVIDPVTNEHIDTKALLDI